MDQPPVPSRMESNHQSALRHPWARSVGFIFLWNSGFIGAEYALPYADPLTLLCWRYALLAVFLFGYLLARKQLRWPGVRPVLVASVVGILAHGVWLGCVFYSIQFGVAAGIVALVVALQPMMTGALSGPVVGERTTPTTWFGLVIGFGGVIVAVMARIELTEKAPVFAYLLPFGSVLAITAASLIQRRLKVRGHASQLPVTLGLFYQSLATAAAALLPAVLLEGLATTWSPALAGSLLWLSLGVSLLAYASMWTLIERVDATRVASLFYFGPPVTMLMAWTTFGDQLLPTDLLGLGIIVLGVSLTHVHVPHFHRSPS